MQKFIFLIIPILLVAGCAGQTENAGATDVSAPTGGESSAKSVHVLLEKTSCTRTSINDAGIPIFDMYAEATASGPVGSTAKIATSTSLDPERTATCNGWTQLDQNSYPYANCQRMEGDAELTKLSVKWSQFGGAGENSIRAHTNFEAEEDSNTQKVTCE